MPARNKINLVGKTMRVLEVLAECGGNATLKELTWRVDLVKSSLFRILFSLKELGYVEQDTDSGRYNLTWKVHGLLRKGGNRTSLVELVRPYMVKLCHEVDETVWLAEWRKGACIVVAAEDASHHLRFMLDIGSIVNLHATAMGKAIAAHLPPKALASALGRGKLKPLTKKTIQSRSKLAAELERVRSDGYAINKGESVEGLIAIAVPIFDRHGMILASMSISIPVFRSTVAKQKAIIVAAKRTAAAITSDMANLQIEFPQ